MFLECLIFLEEHKYICCHFSHSELMGEMVGLEFQRNLILKKWPFLVSLSRNEIFFLKPFRVSLEEQKNICNTFLEIRFD